MAVVCSRLNALAHHIIQFKLQTELEKNLQHDLEEAFYYLQDFGKVSQVSYLYIGDNNSI